MIDTLEEDINNNSNPFQHVFQVLEDTLNYFLLRLKHREVSQGIRKLSGTGIQAAWKMLKQQADFVASPLIGKVVDDLFDQPYENKGQSASLRSRLSRRAVQVVRSSNALLQSAETLISPSSVKNPSYVTQIVDAVREMEITSPAMNELMSLNDLETDLADSLYHPEDSVDYHDKVAHLLKQNQFLSHSINRLASQYFDQVTL